jgi:hypothetical protein
MTVNEESRLDRIERILLQVAEQQQVNTEAITQLQTTQARTQKNLDDLIEETLQMFGDSIAQADQDRAIMREMQSEVRGLQTENRRIFEVLRRRNPGNGNGSGEG